MLSMLTRILLNLSVACCHRMVSEHWFLLFQRTPLKRAVQARVRSIWHPTVARFRHRTTRVHIRATPTVNGDWHYLTPIGYYLPSCYYMFDELLHLNIRNMCCLFFFFFPMSLWDSSVAYVTLFCKLTSIGRLGRHWSAHTSEHETISTS